MGCTIKGKLYNMEAMTKPSKEKTKRKPNQASNHCPKAFEGLKATSKHAYKPANTPRAKTPQTKIP